MKLLSTFFNMHLSAAFDFKSATKSASCITIYKKTLTKNLHMQMIVWLSSIKGLIDKETNSDIIHEYMCNWNYSFPLI